MKQFHVYILASKKNGFLYIGMTSNLLKRIWEHREALVDGHTKKYSIKRLVYFETYDDPNIAAHRERTLKRWRREWKDALIEKNNPDWNDLYKTIAA
jgi:putative endonuclease